LRVISGKLKGKKLLAMPGLSLRPTSDRVKEAIFNILQGNFPGLRVLDLFAGTGALGIEALSRGAQRAVFVEESPVSLDALCRNLAACRLEGESEVVPREALRAVRFLEARGDSFDLVFLDPPYGKGLAAKILEILGGSSLVGPAGLIVAEHAANDNLDLIEGLERVDERRYGRTQVSFYAKKVPETLSL
jgi:16S rRNA (guanine966-N2)-methyltransferase